MSADLTLQAMLNISLGSLTRGREVSREAARLIDEAATKGAETGLRKGIQNSSRELEATWSKLLQAGMRKSGDELREAYQKSAEIQDKFSKKLATVQGALAKNQDAQVRQELLKRKEALQKEIRLQKKAQRQLIKKQDSAAQERLDLMSHHERLRSQSWKTASAEGGQKAADLIQGAFSLDQMDLKSLTEGLSGALAGGLSLGGGAAGSAGLSGAASALISAAGAITAVAGPFAAVMGIISAAYGQTKALNKALLESSSGADILGESTGSVKLLNTEYGALNVRLKMLRNAVGQQAYEFRMSREEVTGYIGALNESGLTVSEFRGIVTGAKNDMEAYASVTRTAVLASQGLGISASETGNFMNKMTRDLGADLTDVQGAFGLIFSEAKKAGMSTKDFFGAINEASSGMALYNFRLNDTVGLFTDMVDILGEDLAKTQIHLEGTFRGMGMSERVKSTMLMGTDRTRRIAQADARAQGKSMGTIGGLDLSSDKGLKKLGGMSAEDFRRVYASVEDPAQKRQLVSVRELAKSMSGGFMDVAQSVGSLSKTGELAAQLSQGASLLNGRAISEASGMQQMMLQEALGISGEQWETLKRLDIGLRSEFEGLRATAQEGDEILSMTFEEALASGLLSQSQTLEEGAAAQYNLMERTAQDQLMETRSMSQTLSNTIATLLENVWLGVEHLGQLLASSFLFGGDTSVMKARQASIKGEGRSQRELENLGQQLVSKRGQLTSENDPVKRVSLQEEITALEKQAAVARRSVEEEQGFRRGLISSDFGDTGAVTSAREMAERSRIRGAIDDRYGDGASIKAGSTLMGDKYRKDPQALAALMGVDVNTLPTFSSGNLNMAGMDPEMQIQAMEAILEQEQAAVEEAAKAEKDRHDQSVEQTKVTEEGFKQMVKEMQSLKREEQIAELTSMLEAGGMSSDAASMAVSSAMRGGSAGAVISGLRSGGVSVKEAALAKALGIGGVAADMTPPVEDFIYRGGGGNGKITPIDSNDEFFGAKPGGPLMGGGSKTVNISINGGDEAKVYAVVKKVLKETGYSDMRSY